MVGASRRSGEGRTLVLGLGNDILSDDSVGLRAARRVAEAVGDCADLVEACVATIDVLPMMAGYDRVLVIDGLIDSTVPPGTPVRASIDELPNGFGHRSFHTLPLGAAIEFGRDLGLAMPDVIVVHGLTVADPATFGEGLSPAVEVSWRAWADRIVDEEFLRG